MTDQIALGFAAVQIVKSVQLFDCFDTLCYDIKTERVGHGDNRFNKRSRVRIARQFVDESSVDF